LSTLPFQQQQKEHKKQQQQQKQQQKKTQKQLKLGLQSNQLLFVEL